MADPYIIGRGYTTALASSSRPGCPAYYRGVRCRACGDLLGGVSMRGAKYDAVRRDGSPLCRQVFLGNAAEALFELHACRESGDDVQLYSVRLTDAGSLTRHEGRALKVGGGYLFVQGRRWCESFPRAKRRVDASESPATPPNAGRGIGCVFGESADSLDHALELMTEFMVGELCKRRSSRERVILEALTAADPMLFAGPAWTAAKSLRDSLRRRHCDYYNMAQDLRRTLKRWAAVGWVVTRGSGHSAECAITSAGCEVLRRALAAEAQR